MAIVSAVQLAA